MRRRTSRGALGWCLALCSLSLCSSACDPKLADRFLCGSGGSCPDGLVCAFDGICRAPANVPEDAAVVVVDLVTVAPADLMSLPDLTPPPIDASNLDLAGCMAVKCNDKGERECGWADDHCGSPIFCGFCPMGKVCGKKRPNKCD